MLTQLHIIQEQRGYTVSVSTTHQTHAGTLVHFTELLAQFTYNHHAAAGDTPPTGATAPCLVAVAAEGAECAATAPAPLFRFGAPGSRSLGGEEPPF